MSRLGAARRGARLLAALLLTALAGPSIVRAQAAPRSPGIISMADLGYNDDTLRGRVFGSSYFFPGPGDYQLAASGSVLELVFSATDLAGPDSAMSISWNGVPVGDVPLSHKSERQTVAIPLPTDRIDPASNRLDVRGSLNLDTSVCRDDSPANHITIYKETAVRYALSDPRPHPSAAATDLARFPAPFIVDAPTTDAVVAMVLPPRPDASTLQAAAAVSARLGQVAGSRPIDLKVAADGGPLPDSLSRANVVYVGPSGSLPGLRSIPGLPVTVGAGGSLARDGNPLNDDDGLLMEGLSPLNPGRVVLAVTGQSGVGVLKAAAALSSPRAARLIGGSSAVIQELETGDGGGDAAAGGQRVLSLADLGRVDQTVNGIGDHTITFKLELPGIPQGGDGLTLDLVTSHSPLLDAANSSVRVTVNDVPLNSVGLKGANQTRNVTQLKLPTSALRSGVNTFDITFTLRVVIPQTQVCPAVPSEQAWAVLHSTTSLRLPGQFKSTTDADLAGYPYPFVSSAGLGRTAFVVPEQFDAAPFLRYCADLGRSLTRDTPPPAVIPANQFQPGSVDANLIVWGTPAQNPVLARLNPNLPLSITPGPTQRYAFAGSLLLSIQDSNNLGVIQELASPWNDGRQILVVSGTSPGSLDLAVTGLAQAGLADNLALVSAAPATATPIPGPAGIPAPVRVTTYKVKPKQVAGTTRSTIEMLPVVMAAAFGLLALVMAASMAYEAFVREPRNRR